MKALLFLLPGLTAAYNLSTNCISCFTQSTQNKFCLENWASTQGYCCNRSNGADYCSSSMYFCSDNALNDAVKLSYCPFNPTQCYGKPISTLEDNSLQLGATTINFTLNSVCSWQLRPQSEYYFNKQIVISIVQTNNVKCAVAYGSDIATASDYTQCSAGDTITIDADKHVFVVV